MNRQLFGLSGGFLLLIAGVAQAAVYDNVYWIGGSGEWTGDVFANPEYKTGHWSDNINATLAQAKPAKLVLGRNDGIRVGEAVGAGGFDLDRVACNEPGCTTTPLAGGVQLGTDIYIGYAPGSAGAVVNYNPNRMFLTGDDGLDRFGDWRIQPNPNFIGTPTLNIANGAKFEHQTTFGGDIDGMWTRWNGAELHLDGAGTEFRRTGDAANGFASGAMMFSSYHGYPNSSQVVTIQNGAKLVNQGQLWIGISGDRVSGPNPAGGFFAEENQPGIRVITTINNGHMDLSGGDEYALDNDNFLSRGDLSFIYDWKHDTDPTNDEKFAINFTGPGSIKVGGKIDDPIDELDGTYTQAELDAEFGAGRGGIRVATQVATGIPGTTPSDYGNDRNIQRSYQDLWNLGILRANNKSALTGHTFSDFFTTTNNPGDNNYTLTSLLAASPIPLRGDFNRDGKVDAADWVLYRKTAGNDGFGDTATTQANLLADADGNLRVDANDLRIWNEFYGRSTGDGGLPVPEPGTMLLMGIGLAMLSVFRRRAN